MPWYQIAYDLLDVVGVVQTARLVNDYLRLAGGNIGNLVEARRKRRVEPLARPDTDFYDGYEGEDQGNPYRDFKGRDSPDGLGEVVDVVG